MANAILVQMLVTSRRIGNKIYRVTDMLVVLPGNPIQNLDTHFVGGPDFLVEVLSPGDQALEKLPFYAVIGVAKSCTSIPTLARPACFA